MPPVAWAAVRFCGGGSVLVDLLLYETSIVYGGPVLVFGLVFITLCPCYFKRKGH